MKTRKALERAFDLKGYLAAKEGERRMYGLNLALRCPVCEKDEKLYVLVEPETIKGRTKQPGQWICYYCGEGGSGPFSLIRWMECCDNEDAFEILVKYKKDPDVLQKDLRALVTSALRDIEPQLSEWTQEELPPGKLPWEFIKADAVEELPPYFAERGIGPKRAARYELGFCLKGKYRNRLVVPIHDAQGLLVFFAARWMKRKPPEEIKKTLYMVGSRPNRVLFNYQRSRGQRRIILVEDVFSAMHLGKGAMSNLGTSLSPYQTELLLRTDAEEIVLLWDRDATVRHTKNDKTCPQLLAGKRCADCARWRKTWGVARALADFWRVKVPLLPDKRDPDEHTKEFIEDLIENTPYLNPANVWAANIRERLAS